MKKGTQRDGEGSHKYTFPLLLLVLCFVLVFWMFYLRLIDDMLWYVKLKPTPYLLGERISSQGESRVGGLQSNEGFDSKVGPKNH